MSDDIESLWSYCTSNGRVVPMPREWNRLYGMLKDRQRTSSGGWNPPVPLILAAWHDSPAVMKILRFRAHLDWALEHDQLAEIGAFLRALPEESWCHLGEV